MTPELRAAVERVTAYLAAHKWVLGDLDKIAECGTPERSWATLTVTDLRVLLAALDPADQPPTFATCTRCGATIHLDDEARIGWHPVMRGPADIGTCEGSGQKPAATADRHQPLTDQPIDHIPTPAGLDYLRDRRQQHPKADTDA